MTYIYILGYITMGLVVAKCFQKWVNKSALPSLDVYTFLISIITWPIVLFVLIFLRFIDIIIWFYNLGNKK